MREMDGRVKVALREVVPCAAIVLVEGCIIGLTIMASTAMARGMSPFVFVVYTNVLGSIILLPYSFLYERDRSDVPLVTFPFLLRVFLLGLIGITIAQNLAFLGLSYSSPIVACGMANQIPAFSFIIGIILRTTKFDWKSSGSQARLIGTVISIVGAISLTLYRGPTIKNHSSPSLAFPVAAPPRLLVFSSPHENWALGGILFAASSLTLAIWNIVQAIFSSVIRSNVLIWCTRLKGPYFVPAFKPFGIPYASTFGCLLFPDTFHYGSMMGAFICGVGYYTVLWGQIKDDETQKSDDGSKNSDEKVPLLQDQDQSQV